MLCLSSLLFGAVFGADFFVLFFMVAIDSHHNKQQGPFRASITLSGCPKGALLLPAGSELRFNPVFTC